MLEFFVGEVGGCSVGLAAAFDAVEDDEDEDGGGDDAEGDGYGDGFAC